MKPTRPGGLERQDQRGIGHTMTKGPGLQLALHQPTETSFEKSACLVPAVGFRINGWWAAVDYKTPIVLCCDTLSKSTVIGGKNSPRMTAAIVGDPVVCQAVMIEPSLVRREQNPTVASIAGRVAETQEEKRDYCRSEPT